MTRVEKVMEPYDNQTKLTTFFKAKTCKSVQFDWNTAGGLRKLPKKEIKQTNN
jgi:hypothetical protein